MAATAKQDGAEQLGARKREGQIDVVVGHRESVLCGACLEANFVVRGSQSFVCDKCGGTNYDCAWQDDNSPKQKARFGRPLPADPLLADDEDPFDEFVNKMGRTASACVRRPAQLISTMFAKARAPITSKAAPALSALRLRLGRPTPSEGSGSPSAEGPRLRRET
mmetsp:Transcript_70009/g.202896  ORF Transcript_70009/g.202896 Transcript_70009/m.202896 type:complete len:165 (+) Transcript_70009:96-590(+)